MKVTNIDKGPRGINTDNGPMLLDPGQTADVEVSAAELKVAKATGWFDFGKTAAAKPKGEGGGSKADQAKAVLAMANDDNVHFMTFKSKAHEVLGDATPSGKEEIVKALEEVATQP